MDFGQTEVIYRAEGNANLVLALPQYKKVLRLPKTSIISTTSDSSARQDDGRTKALADDDDGEEAARTRTGIDGSTLNQKRNQDVPSLEDYATYIGLMGHFIGAEYTSVPEVVCISSSMDRQRLKRLCDPFRPADRRDKHFCGQFGLLLPDATLLPDTMLTNLQLLPRDTFAIEIKPKQGWMLQDNINSFHNSFDLKASVRCRYCAMQFSKLRSCKITKLSGYCPMDLFSGNRSRMKDALDGLLQCPQNNLRVFRNGNLIYGNHSTSISFDELKDSIFKSDLDAVVDVVLNSLLANYSDKLDPALNVPNADTNIPANCALWYILQVQLLAKINMEAMNNMKVSNEKTYDTLNKLLMRENQHINDLCPDEQYMLAATMMDCSVMIAFHEIHSDIKNDSNRYIISVNGRRFVTKVTLLDLDPKPDNHFRKYVEVTNKAYRNAMEFEMGS